jgi:hypothetical protein
MAEQKKSKSWQAVSLLIVFLCYLGLRLWGMHWPKMDLELRDQQLHVLVANTVNHQIKGLGGRKDLGEYDGMIFIYNSYSRLGFLMRDMRFPIDIIWLKDAKVVDFVQKVQPEPGVKEIDLQRYYPRTEANAVLELSAGWAEKNGLKIGDQLTVLKGK